MANEVPLSATCIANYPAAFTYMYNIASDKEVENETDSETCVISFIDSVSDISSSDCDVHEEPPKDVILQGDHVSPQEELVSPQLEPQVDETRSDKHTVTFHDVSYEVSQWKYCRRQPNKIILHSVSGLMPSGLNAIMGPTGCGKTTLMDILADRKDKSGLSGTVLFNGSRKPPNFKRLVGYVVQEDVVTGTLTVRENLQFSAALRLPSHMTRRQRKERVERVIAELGLQNCANTKLGTEFIRGVSGGERRRTNIGMELIIEPQVLFLDEPTTGLDAHTAVSVVQLLRNLSQVSGRIVIMSIHQPRYSIFKLFDTLTLISMGNIIYHGLPDKALEYLENLGFHCEEHENPADFILDVVLTNQNNGNVDLVGSYQASEQFQQLKAVLGSNKQEEVYSRDPYNKISRFINRKYTTSANYPTNVLWQVYILCMRSLVNNIRNPAISVLQIFSATVFAIILGIIYFQLDTDELGFSNRLGVLFFITINTAFASVSTIEHILQQKLLFLRENTSGYYRVSAFFISQVLLDVLPIQIVPNTVAALITYFMIGLQMEVDKFFIYFLFVNVISITSASITFCIVSFVEKAAIANLLIILYFVIFMQFAGLLIALDSLPVFVDWIKYLSLFRYATEGLAINEMDGLTFTGRCDLEGSGYSGSRSSCNNPGTFDGLDELERLGYETDWLWYDVAGLICISLFFQILAYVILRCIKKNK